MIVYMDALVVVAAKKLITWRNLAKKVEIAPYYNAVQ